jgi:ATP-dependent DNA helicase RecG
MISKAKLAKLFSLNEDYRIERTTSITNTDKFCQAICAFSNDLPNTKLPGYLLIGVNDNGSLAGLKVTDELLKNISAIRSDGNILPIPVMSVEKFIYPQGEVLVVEVHPSPYPPVRYRGRTWIRIGPRKDIASDSEERLLTERRVANISTFDTTPCFDSTINDLNTNLFTNEYLNKAIAEDVKLNETRRIEDQLASLRFFDTKINVPTFAGILLFGNKPEYFLPGAYIQYVRFAGFDNASDIRNEYKFTGNIISIINKLDTFLDTSLIQKHPIPVSTLKEKMVYNFPRWAIRELLMNAIMHRDYQSNMPIKLYQYIDRIEITNSGGLYGNVRPENFPDTSDYRNPIIAEAMKTLDYVNKFNRGISRVQKELLDNGNLEATFNISKMTVFGVSVNEKFDYQTIEKISVASDSAVYKKRYEIKNPTGGPNRGQIEVKGSQIEGPNGGQMGVKLTETRTKIMLAIQENPHITQFELVKKIGITRKNIRRHLEFLVQNQYLLPEDKTKASYWIVLKKI